MPKREMLINYVPGEECRIAITEDGRLEEFYHERASSESHVGNIYKGKVTNVEPSIQAAFVDFGQQRNGFLHISDLHPMYFAGADREETERVGKKTPHRERPPVQKCLRRGQEVLVQVLKEGIGTKGPTLTSYLSIPGRFLVMMPSMERLGVSRKVEDDDARRDMRKILDELKPPDGFGFIIRTAGIGRTKTDLKRDLAYLTRLWKSIERRKKTLKGVGELYTESDLIIRTIRDVFSTDIDRIIIDHVDAARRARDFLAIASPRAGSKIMVYRDPVPLFHRYDIESQIETINAREVPLKSGGSIVIDSTEALVAIDVNSGKSRDARDAETNAFRTNQEATDEICRQLRLRDLGGVIVNDLIDMRQAGNRRKIENQFRDNLKRDRARTKVLAISQFGIVEMTRQRMRPSINRAHHVPCTACNGSGHVPTPENVALDVMRRLCLAMAHDKVVDLRLTVSPDVAFLLLNKKRGQLSQLETRTGKPVLVRVNSGAPIDFIELIALDERGGAVEVGNVGSLGEPVIEAVDDVVRDDVSREAEEPLDDDFADDDDFSDTDDTDDDDADKDAPAASQKADDDGDASQQQSADDDGDGQPRKRRRRRRGGRGRRKKQDGDDTPQSDDGSGASPAQVDQDADDSPRTDTPAEDEPGKSDDGGGDGDTPGQADGEPKKKRRRRGSRGGRRRNRRKDGQPNQPSEGADDAEKSSAPEPADDPGYSNEAVAAGDDKSS